MFLQTRGSSAGESGRRAAETWVPPSTVGIMSAATAITETAPVNTQHGVVSIGYEGREVAEFVRDLLARRVTVLADVRLNAVSRRRGFSKTALRETLEAAGIEYVHLRGLGNPSDNRAAFAGDDATLGQRRFRQLLKAANAQRDLATLRELTASTVVAVLCVERDEHNCHRSVVIDALRQ